MNIQSFQWVGKSLIKLHANCYTALSERWMQHQYLDLHLQPTHKSHVFITWLGVSYSIFLLDTKHKVRLQKMHWILGWTEGVLCPAMSHIWVQETFKQACCCSLMPCVKGLGSSSYSTYLLTSMWQVTLESTLQCFTRTRQTHLIDSSLPVLWLVDCWVRKSSCVPAGTLYSYYTGIENSPNIETSIIVYIMHEMSL